MVAGVRMSAVWVPRAALLSAAGLLAVFGLMNPDAFVANRNIDRFEATGKLDQQYLASLSKDATPVILNRLKPEDRQCVFAYRNPPAVPESDPLGWNWGRAKAAAAIDAGDIPPAPETCYDPNPYSS